MTTLDVPPVTIEFDEDSHSYLANGEPVTGVTSLIGKVTPKELQWWGMQVGIRAVAQLYDLGDPKAIEEAVKLHKLTVNDVRDSAATRGKSVHKALEDYANDGTIPNLADFPEDDRGYVQALANFFIDAQPEFEVSEKQVAYPEYGYAGTLDLIARVEAKELPVKKFRGKVKTELFDGRGLFDLKTSKRVYPLSHFPQLAAYDRAYVRMGGDATDFQAVLHVTPGGEYFVCRSTARFADFIAYREAFLAQQRITGKA